MGFVKKSFEVFLETPTTSSKVRLVLAGIRRTKGTAQQAKTPVLIEDLLRMVAHLPETLLGVRDRAILVVGFSGAFRRSELVALNVADAAFTRDGLTLTIRRSKTDQEGAGRKIGLPYGSNLETCPIRSLQGWLEDSKITEGPLFRPINRHGKMRLSGFPLPLWRISSSAMPPQLEWIPRILGDTVCGRALPLPPP